MPRVPNKVQDQIRKQFEKYISQISDHSKFPLMDDVKYGENPYAKSAKSMYDFSDHINANKEFYVSLLKEQGIDDAQIVDFLKASQKVGRLKNKLPLGSNLFDPYFLEDNISAGERSYRKDYKNLMKYLDSAGQIRESLYNAKYIPGSPDQEFGSGMMLDLGVFD
jgi:hypothetical protein